MGGGGQITVWKAGIPASEASSDRFPRASFKRSMLPHQEGSFITHDPSRTIAALLNLIISGSTMPQGQGETVPPQQEQRVERRLAAIFAADVAGYSRLMSQDEAGTLARPRCRSRDHGRADRRPWGQDRQHGWRQRAGRVPERGGCRPVRGGGSGEARQRRAPESPRIAAFSSGSASTSAMWWSGAETCSAMA